MHISILYLNLHLQAKKWFILKFHSLTIAARIVRRSVDLFIYSKAWWCIMGKAVLLNHHTKSNRERGGSCIFVHDTLTKWDDFEKLNELNFKIPIRTRSSNIYYIILIINIAFCKDFWIFVFFWKKYIIEKHASNKKCC